MNSEERINSLLKQFDGLCRACMKRLEAGADDSDLRERMAEIKRILRLEEESQKKMRLLQ